MSPPRRRIALVLELEHPLGSAWGNVLAAAGHRVVALHTRDESIDAVRRRHWCLDPDVTVVPTPLGTARSRRAAIEAALGGPPDVLYGWWGSPILNALIDAAKVWPGAAVGLCVDTLPNAVHLLAELRELGRFRRAAPHIDFYVHYSAVMEARFRQAVPEAARSHHAAFPEAFPRSAWADRAPPWGPRLARRSPAPHVVFVGRGDRLWSLRPSEIKDALGPRLARLAAQGVEVFVPSGSDTRGVPGLHPYPYFRNAELFDGTFARYLSDFDAQLVVYREPNGTVARRVAAGLSTRLATALTATAPLVVSPGSTFLAEHEGDGPLALRWTSDAALVAALSDAAGLAALRAALAERGPSFALEARLPVFDALMSAAIAKRRPAQRQPIHTP